MQFLLTATDWLMAGGVMAFVCPEHVVGDYSSVRNHFAGHYENCQILPFPASHRRFHEVLVLGHKRARLHAADSSSWDAVQAPAGFLYHIPAGPGPRLFQKVEPTESELQRLLARSPLRTHLTAPSVPTLSSPPLALGTGHVALLLASGYLDGLVHPPGKAPHVVRGSARKQPFVADVTEVANPDGSITTKTTLSERIDLVVRTIDLTGEIRTFRDAEAQP
jgi:hypothetical protein